MKKPAITPRQLAVLQLIALGLSSDEIAERHAVSRKTVEAQRARAVTALGARNSPHAVFIAGRLGLIDGLAKSPKPRVCPSGHAQQHG